jgi:excinuclease ABC subunit C
MEQFKIISKKKLSELPKTSGVYSFFNAKNLIYIGKAINIQNRVKNHFQQPSYRDRLFMDKVDKIGYLPTNSEIEALILEANLIKRYQPKFNVVWRDDKNYFYVAIENNKDGIPFIYITHQPNPKPYTLNPVYIGPFVEGTALKKTLRFLRRVFPYYTVKKHPKTKCTYCHLGLCPRLFEARLASPFGEAADLIAEYKNNIKKLILILKGKRNAVLNSLKKEMKALSAEKKFEKAGKIRDRIYNLQQVMSHTNIINTTKVGGTSDVPPTLNKILGINKKIYRIECYDVSNIQGKQATGSMVVFIDDAPNKNQYRKFKIKMKNEPNDIAMLKETLQRRFAHPEWKYPEVILIDGGIAQLNIAIKTKNEKIETRDIKVISIAKRNKDLYIEGKKGFVPLKTLPQEIYNLILQLDDEAHRFAIAYHKKLRKKNLMG